LVGLVRLLVAAGLLAFGLGLLGRVWWVFDLMANYRPQVGVVLLTGGAIAWVVDRTSGMAATFGGLVALAGVAPFYLGSHPMPAASNERIEIIAFNVGVSNPNRLEVAAYLAEEDPDVVFLFESSFEWEDAIRRADVPLTIITVVPRGQLAGVTVLASPEIDPTALEVDIGREVAALSVVLDGDFIDIIGVHPPSPTTAARAEERDRILSEAAGWVKDRESPVVLVGDLNVTPWSAAYRTLRWRGWLLDSLHGSGIQASWPVNWGMLSIPIDHVLHTPELGSTDRRTGPSLGSAHRPVVVSIGHR
jgi:endonuclease/exonuclease/phosphatase (EEP) superfamily protein YafD